MDRGGKKFNKISAVPPMLCACETGCYYCEMMELYSVFMQIVQCYVVYKEIRITVM